MIYVIVVAVIGLAVWVYVLSKRPYLDIDEDNDELVLRSGKYEIKRFIKIEKK